MRAKSGKHPSRKNASSICTVGTPRKPSRASTSKLGAEAPAYTYTNVPGNIPNWLTHQNVRAFIGVNPISALMAGDRVEVGDGLHRDAELGGHLGVGGVAAQ